MIWILFAVGAALAWGIYGPMLHKAQMILGNPLKAFLMVGFAYFLVAVLVPMGSLWQQGELKGFPGTGILAGLAAGALGAAGAICIIWSFKSGGTPLYVMPLVFGGAPLVNVLISLMTHPPKTEPNPLLYAGFLLTAVGAGMVLYFKPAA